MKYLLSRIFRKVSENDGRGKKVRTVAIIGFVIVGLALFSVFVIYPTLPRAAKQAEMGTNVWIESVDGAIIKYRVGIMPKTADGRLFVVSYSEKKAVFDDSGVKKLRMTLKPTFTSKGRYRSYSDILTLPPYEPFYGVVVQFADGEVVYTYEEIMELADEFANAKK
ncbi:MAG: hypothetical protein LBS90_01065 [Oscillospiraceae bacterium]|jgi:hypothetical protein|nr:hypothetical protein [Oscillospiraceae bacterium]